VKWLAKWYVFRQFSSKFSHVHRSLSNSRQSSKIRPSSKSRQSSETRTTVVRDACKRKSRSSAVFLKREPLGSHLEFLIPWAKFAPGRNCGGKAEGKQLKCLFLLVYATQKNCTTRWVQIGLSLVRKHKLLHHCRLSQFLQSAACPSKSLDRC